MAIDVNTYRTFSAIFNNYSPKVKLIESVSIDNEYEYENESISYSYSLSFL